MKNKKENQMTGGADWEPLANGIMQEPRLFQIGFVGIADEVGTTTAAAATAVTIGRQRGRAVFAGGECPREGKPRTLDYLGLRTVLQKDRPPLYQDVNWQLAKLETPQSLDDIPRQAPVYQTAFATPGGILILDRPPQEKWKECDVLVCVVDPLPARVLAGLARHHQLRAEQEEREKRGEHSLLWVMNKANPAVDKRELERFLRIRFDATLPLLPAEFFYQAAYQDLPWMRSLYADEKIFRKQNQRTVDFCESLERLVSSIFSALPQIAI